MAPSTPTWTRSVPRSRRPESRCVRDVLLSRHAARGSGFAVLESSSPGPGQAWIRCSATYSALDARDRLPRYGSRKPHPAEAVLKESSAGTAVVIISDAGAARGRFDPVRLLDTVASLKGLRTVSTRVVWLNPLPATAWAAGAPHGRLRGTFRCLRWIARACIEPSTCCEDSPSCWSGRYQQQHHRRSSRWQGIAEP